jgi:hypothetical protein
MSRNTKPVVSMRKPPAPATVEAFVRGDQPAVSLVTSAPAHAPAPQAEQPGIVARQDGRTRRRMTVYLPPDLAQALKVQSAMSGKEMSDLIADALRAHLDL